MDANLALKIRSATINEVLDYLLLSYILRDYKAPRDVITSLLKSEVLIRVKKGIYVFGAAYRKKLIPLEVIANLIYGPSYVSREYALHFHGLIPESVSEITCMTTKRSKNFHSPIARFSYNTVKGSAYSIGVEWHETSNNQGFFIASPEKALVDMIITKNEEITDINTFTQILIKDYRIDENALRSLNINTLVIITRYYNKPIVKLLLDTISELNHAR